MSLVAVAEPPPINTDADGVVRIAGTRVTLDTIVGAFLEGARAETIADQYPSLSLGDVYTTIGYYLRHRSEVNAYLQTRRQQAEEVGRQNEAAADPVGVRARLLARRTTQG